jgi:hypothetical protein
MQGLRFDGKRAKWVWGTYLQLKYYKESSSIIGD